MRLLGAPIPIEGEFCRLGIGIRVNPERGTGPLLRQWIERGGGGVLPRMPHLATYHRRSVVARRLAMAVALHGVELADVSNVDLARVETRTVQAIWGPTRPSRAQGSDLLPPVARPPDFVHYADEVPRLADLVG